MESRIIFTIFFAVVLGTAILDVSAQIVSMDAFIPCGANVGCQDPRLPAEAYCKQGFCMCPNEYGTESKCTVNATHGRSMARGSEDILKECTIDQDCTFEHGVCNTTRRQCACQEGFIIPDEQDKRCLAVAQHLGADCEMSIQCSTNITNSECIDKQCVCSSGYHIDQTHNNCTKSSGLHHPCTEDKDCSDTEFTVCNKDSSMCMCNETSVMTDSGDKCLTITTEMSGPCEESVQCRKNFAESVCIDKTCQCGSYTHFVASLSKCVSTRNLGENCSEDHECHQDDENDVMTGPQKCVDTVCTCSENFLRDGDKCVSSGASSLVSGILSSLMAILLFSRS